MLIRIMDAAAVAGGKAVLLCDDDGKPLPFQIETMLHAAVGEHGSITVKFQIDGKKIRFAD